MVATLTPTAHPLTPPLERCPQCGQPAPLRHKGRPLVRCAACSLTRLRERKRAYDAARSLQSQERRHRGGVSCPAYVAWTVEPYGPEDGDGPGVYVVRARSGWPAAMVMPAYGACSCGVAGCVHLVVALLAQRGGQRDG